MTANVGLRKCSNFESNVRTKSSICFAK